MFIDIKSRAKPVFFTSAFFSCLHPSHPSIAQNPYKIYTYAVLKKIPKITQNAAYPILLFIIILVICIKNYTPGTFLTGWDTLHPEFNLGLYWQRILGGVWQEHQGLGAVASQSHASEIPRMVILTILNLIFGMSFVRYAYAFLMLFLGPFGIYFFLKDILLRKYETAPKYLGAFTGALFYLLNLGTLQHFYVPLEMFLTHFGFLGWYMWSSSQYYSSGNRKYLILYFLFTLFGASQAHTSTLFYAYFIYLIAYFTIIVLIDTSAKSSWRPFLVRRGLTVLFITLAINAFWLLPNMYYAVNHGGEVNMSKIHGLFSNEAFQANKKYGGTRDVAILRSFLFSWGEHVGNSQYGELLDEWILHLNGPGVTALGYIFFILVCIGITTAVIKREKFAYGVFMFFSLGIFFLFNVNPPFGNVFVFLQDNIPLFKEAFRFPFTKFSIGLMFSYSVFFGYFMSWYTSLFYKVTHKILLPRFVQLTILITMTTLMIYYMWPAFSGHLISPSMRVKIPERYFKMFDFFDAQKDYGRVADFPVHSFWGWMYYNWDNNTQLGYQGAGFLWFGIKQPLMNREFDRWNLLNEQYYREMSYAVYSQNSELLLQVLDKYKIHWLLVDESVIVPAADSKQLFFTHIFGLFDQTGKIHLTQDFGDGLKVFEYTPTTPFTKKEEYEVFYEAADKVYKEYTDPIYSSFQPYVSVGEEHFPYVGITSTDEALSSEYIQSQGAAIYINPKFVTTEAILGGSEGGVNVPMTLSVVRDSVSGSLDFSIRLLSTGSDVWSSQVNVGLDQPLVIKANNETGGIFYNAGESTRKETVFNYSLALQNRIDIYKLTEKDVANANYTGELEPCSDLYASSTYEVTKIDDGFTLTGDNVKACLTVPMVSLIKDTSETNPFYVIKAQVTPENPYAICVFSSKSGLCENYYRDGAHLVSFTDSISNYYLRFLSNALGRGEKLSTSFQNIKLYGVEETATLQVNVPKSDTVAPTLSEPYKTSRSASYGGKAVDLDHYYRYCNLIKNQEDVPNVSEEPGILTYSSAEDAVCDSFPLPYLTHKTGYLLEIRSRNISGSPLRMCLTNEYSKRCDIYVELPKNSSMESNYYLVPPMGEHVGYTVNFSNLIFGGDFTKNQIESVLMTPIPYDYLRGFHTTVPVSDNKKLLVLNESYEKGWVAICGIVPCRADHVKVNNWSNGWIFEKNADISGVRFIFWPESLEYIGLFLLMPIVVFIVRYKEINNGDTA